MLAAPRFPLVEAGLSAMAFLAIALSGHANSAEPRPLAVATDWLHLLAGAVWMGGLAQIASGWLTVVRRRPGELGRQVMTSVLRRFGALALPAFLAVLATGSMNALIQLGTPEETFFITRRGKVVGHVIGVVSPAQMRAGIAASRSGRPAGLLQGGDRRTTR